MAETGTTKMNKQQPNRLKHMTTDTPPAKPVILPDVVESVPVVARTAAGRIIEEYRHCPLCWQGNGGYGDCYSTQGRTRYYKCVKTIKPESGPCGHTWTATVLLETIKIEHRIVTLDGER